jgi:glucose/arabinose dehydrogenase
MVSLDILRRRLLPILASTVLTLTACGGGGSSASGTGAGTGTGGGSGTGTSAPTPALQRAFPLLSFTAPVAMLQAPADNSRWFVVEQAGRVRSFTNDQAAATTSIFADLSARVTSGGETGLLGMAFPPSFPNDPRVFLFYSTTVGGQLMSHVSSFTTSNMGQTFNPSSEIVLLNINKPESNHNGGDLHFGPDGLLYIATGDGGGGGDAHGMIGNAQETRSLLGKILRIDVSGSPYTIPAGNPFGANARCNVNGSGTASCPEIYHYGLRNPWRFSFDRDAGAIWIGDVGQDLWEEVDRTTLGSQNFGWRCREGAHDFNLSCGGATGLVEPVAEYGHSVGQSITGGYVYRGTAYTNLRGFYLFADFISRRLFVISGTPPVGTQSIISGTSVAQSISSFGEGNDRELYAVDYSGGLYRVTAQ